MEHRDDWLVFGIYVEGRRWKRTLSKRRAQFLLAQAKLMWPLCHSYILPY